MHAAREVSYDELQSRDQAVERAAWSQEMAQQLAGLDFAGTGRPYSELDEYGHAVRRPAAAAGVEDRRATLAEVVGHREQLVALLAQHGLRSPRLRGDGALVVDTDQPSYQGLAEFSATADDLVGAHVYVLVSTAPGAAGVDEPL